MAPCPPSPVSCLLAGAVSCGGGMPACAEPAGGWEAVHDRLRVANGRRRQEMTEALSRLARISTVRDLALPNRNQAGIDEALAVIQQLCGGLGLAYRASSSGRVGLVEIGDGAETVGVLGHMDVVPGGDGWEHDAFSGAIVDGEVWGRGTQDDKGPLVSALYAFAAVSELGLPLRRRVRLIIGTQEETGEWGDLGEYFATEAPPDLSFAVDALFPVINAEKGFANLTVTWDGVPAAEAGPVLVALDAGQAPNMVPDCAWAALAMRAAGQDVAELVDRYHAAHQDARVRLVATEQLPPEGRAWRDLGCDCFLQAAGRTAHGAKPEEGHSALLDLCELLAGLELAPSTAGHVASYIACSVGQELDGRTLGIAAVHDIMGATTVNVGLVRTQGSRCAATLNIRFPQGLTQHEVLAAVQTAADRHQRRLGRQGGTVSVAMTAAHEPLYVPADTEIVCTLSEVYTAMTGRPAELLSVGGTTYAKAVPNAVSFGPLMPGERGLEHAPNERVSIESLVRNAGIYAAALAHLCLGEPPTATQ